MCVVGLFTFGECVKVYLQIKSLFLSFALKLLLEKTFLDESGPEQQPCGAWTPHTRLRDWGVRISAASTGWLHVIQQRANFDRAGLGPSPPLRLCTAVRFRRADDHPMVGGICESPPTLRAAWRHLGGSSMASHFHIYSSFTQSQSFPYLPPLPFFYTHCVVSRNNWNWLKTM